MYLVITSGVLGDGIATRDLSPNPYTSARQIRWFGGYSHQVFPFSHQKMLYFGLDVRGHGYLATTNLSSAAIHPIFKPISGQTSIWNSKPANRDNHDQHSDLLRLGSMIDSFLNKNNKLWSCTAKMDACQRK